jgi:hypothetical protein
MSEGTGTPYTLPARVARVALSLFLVAIVVALLVTLVSVSPPVRLLAGAVVLPILGLGLLFLYLERRGHPWSFVGAAALGALGVVVRLIVNSRPNLEVGGGLPLSVTVVYASLGLLVAASSLWAYSAERTAARATHERSAMR